ncbi:hypothetical protein [Roseobacter sp. GAI101]|uniref:hypothetical protein n=1 Tax=Roseobacter sp. (strain GAI101) TaxID=391589 RepID=UPI0001871DB7|nr:hypothetical protein [Roseobacter sp. GAI101]EEB84877.1 conserved hypothetical protein [Roseobacter sp. GAI101]
MSDPVTNAEVEDVLSSIRRLVSEERRPLNRAKPEAKFEDKLVLTPSLRVSNDAPLVDAYKKQAPDVSPTEWDDRAVVDVADKDVLEDRFAEAETAEGQTGAGAFDDLYPALDGDADADVQAWQDHDDASAGGPDSFDFSNPLHNFDPTSDEFDIEPLKLHNPRKEVQADEPAKSAEKPLPSFTTSRSNILNLGDSELVEDVPPTPDRLSAKIAALESAISRIPENWEPDAPGDDDYSGSEAPAMVWEDDVEFDAKGAPLRQVKTPQPDEAIESAVKDVQTDTTDDHSAEGARLAEEFRLAEASRFARDEDHFDEDEGTADAGIGLGPEEFLDEAMLRDLVSEIVRSELQGVLGERITRNVRKLVRREIHRALTAQDLE